MDPLSWLSPIHQISNRESIHAVDDGVQKYSNPQQIILVDWWMLRWKLKYIHFHLDSMGWHWPAVIPARVRTAYWQANADGWTEFESVSAGCGWVEARGAAGQQSAPRPVKRYQKSADGARAVCRLVQAASWWIPNHRKHLDPFLVRPQPPAHTSHAQSINTLPIWTVSFSNHISPTWPGPQQMRRSANNSWPQRNDEMKTIVCTLWGRWGRWSVV